MVSASSIAWCRRKRLFLWRQTNADYDTDDDVAKNLKTA